MKSPRVTIQALHPFWFSFLHFQIILPDLAWFFMEYVNISASCMVLCWPALSWKGMNLSSSCSPRKNPAKFHWKYSFLFFSYFLNWSQKNYLVGSFCHLLKNSHMAVSPSMVIDKILNCPSVFVHDWLDFRSCISQIWLVANVKF